MLVGSGELVLDCIVETDTNANWEIGEIYQQITTTCKPVTLILA